MKTRLYRYILPLIMMVTSLSSCVYVANTPGPPGNPGRAYFGVDYGDYHPERYWDNNPSIPTNPFLGEYYPTRAGVFEFEYFITPYDYWWGTYEIWINPGGPGGPHGEPGFNGADSYLMLIGDRFGMYEERLNKTSEEPIVFEDQVGTTKYKITMQKANIYSRPAHDPKFLGPGVPFNP